VIADPGVVQEAVRLWPEAVAVALDARGGKVAVAGWKEVTTEDAVDLARRVGGWGVRRIQYTDVQRDGTLVGPNLKGIEEVARASGLRVTAAGGVSCLDDLRRLRELTPPACRRGRGGKGALRTALQPRRGSCRHGEPC
jgi:phosphoribosylformimino-5-aminoimidazole carboxamide ribotide isomerase